MGDVSSNAVNLHAVFPAGIAGYPLGDLAYACSQGLPAVPVGHTVSLIHYRGVQVCGQRAGACEEDEESHDGGRARGAVRGARSLC